MMKTTRSGAKATASGKSDHKGSEETQDRRVRGTGLVCINPYSQGESEQRDEKKQASYEEHRKQTAVRIQST